VFAFVASVASAQLQQQLSPRPQQRVTAKVDRKVLSSLRGTHPSVVDHAKIGARMNPGTQLQHMVLVLAASDEQNSALLSLMDAQQDKTSTSYHKWLTPDTFGTSFGVAPTDIGQVSAWLSDGGLKVETVSRSGRFITFSGPVSAVESTFNTEMHQVTVNGEAHISNTTDVSVPSALAPVVKGVAKLNDFQPKSSAQTFQKVTLGPDYGTAPASTHYIGAADMAKIYNATPLTSAGNTGQGVTIAVLARSNIQLADVENYRSFFGLPKNDPNIIVVGPDPGQNSDDIEAFLDAEMAGSLATGATVDFIVSDTSLVGSGIDQAGLYAVDNNVGDIITLSYGGCEASNGYAGTQFWDNLWEEAAAQGQTVFVSSGDAGAAGCDDDNTELFATTPGNGYGVNALGSSNYNVSVGGSMFVDYAPTTYWQNGGASAIPYGTALGYIPEAALNQSRLNTTELNAAATGLLSTSGATIFAGGGGISLFTPRPSWQTGSGISATADPTAFSGTGLGTESDGVSTVPGTIAGPHRLVPDLSFISANGHDGTLFCAEGVCQESATGTLADAGIVGGTSVAAPAMASVQALINAANGGRQGNANYYYYALAQQQYVSMACQAAIGSSGHAAATSPASTCNFHDIIAGSNIVPTAATGTAGIGFTAGAGYDAASGLGSVNIANVANNWHTVTFNSTTTSFTLTPTTTTHGSNQTFSIQVGAGGGTPTGDVSIIATGVTATGSPLQFTLSGGAASGTISSLPGGSYSVHAHYAGDGVYAPSDSSAIAVTIGKENTTIGSANDPFQPFIVNPDGSLSLGSTSGYGVGELYLDTEVFSASGNGATAANLGNPNGTNGANGTPSGTVTFAVTKNGSPYTGLTAALDSYGTTYLLAGTPFTNFGLVPNYATLGVGSYSVTATYSGDTSFNTSTNTTTFTVTKGSPYLEFDTPTPAIVSGGTATVDFITETFPGVAPASGTVTFTDTTTSASLGTLTLVNGEATLSTTALTAAGAHNISATYSGDSNYLGGTVSGVTITVSGLTATTTTITVGTGPKVSGVTVTAVINVTPSMATTLSIYDSSTLLGSLQITAKSTRITGLSISAGAHTLTAVFSGNTTQGGSTSAPVAITVAKATTTTAIGGGETSTYGQTVSFNGTITPATGSTVTLTGLVNFYDGGTTGTLIGSATPIYGANYGYYTGTINTSTLSVGTHTIVASYVGDSNYTTSTSIAAPLVVAKASQTITITGLPSNATFPAGPYVLSATSSVGLPVTLSVAGPATLSGSTVTITGVGTVVVTAMQAGNGSYLAASKTATLIVAKGSQTITFTGLPASVNYAVGESYVLNGSASSGLAVTYSITGPATLKGTTLTLTGPGTVSVTASQAGNVNYNAATPVTQTILAGTVSLATSGVLSKIAGGYQMVVTVTNSGNVTAPNVQLTVATLGAASGTVIPASFGSIANGASASVTLTFPSSAGADGAGVVEKLTGTYTGGTFGGSFRAVLP
jgi:hypothetical protein